MTITLDFSSQLFTNNALHLNKYLDEEYVTLKTALKNSAIFKK